jgi:NAD(P)-dependent dehydrogenase (short-subunit alcohol dehydrogenase family)
LRWVWLQGSVNNMDRILENRCAIITGASLGLGFEIAKKYLEAGASLMICARNAMQLDKAALKLEKLAGSGQSVLALPADVSKPKEVAALVEQALSKFGRVDIVVNNAAIVGPCGAIETVDWEEWVRTVEINLLGAVLLSRAILPHFKQAAGGKIIQLSGGGATNPLPMLSAYAASKAAVIRFVETLAEETRQDHIDVNAIAPGALNTRMLDEFIAAGPEAMGPAFHERSLRQRKDGGIPLHKGADLAVFLGSSLSNGITGKLISAVWDPWESLPNHLADLNATDVYTLRRILPEDRGLTWGDGD